jgi:L,D-peptidoglycan transpeptidase YkuD (ErfK/YbiS/YcfS/YnhG family)
MHRFFKALAALLLIIAIPAGAASNLPKYTLVVSGKPVALSASTGYLGKSGSRMTIPLKTVLDALGMDYSTEQNGRRMYIEGPKNTRVGVAAGYAFARVDGRKKSLRSKAYMKNGQLMADVSVLTLLNVHYKAAKAKALKGKGYPSGGLSISPEKKSVSFPPLKAQSDSFSDQYPAARLTDQLIVVQYKSGSTAALTMHEKGANGQWQKTLSSTAYVGKNGIGKTREGDKKTPTGTFNLTQAFGIKSNPGTALPYVKVTKHHYWCGTSGSKYYNQLVDTRVTDRARTSSDEHLIRYAGVYNYGVFIDYNASGEKGKGSCIFLHCQGSKKYTAGCIAVPQSTMIKILKALKPGAKIVIA